MTRFIRQTMVVARRDFVAIVFTPTFLIFLLAPLFMIAFGAIGGVGAASLGEGSQDRARIVVVADAATGARYRAADTELRTVFRPTERPPALELRAPAADPAAQARALFDAEDIEATAVLYGLATAPVILRDGSGGRSASYLAAMAEAVAREARAGRADDASRATVRTVARTGSTDTGRQAAGFFAVFAMFLVTLLLASQAVGMLAEERGNKVIEVLAAAVPLESVFLGKLIGLFGVAILFITFWLLVGSQALMFLPRDAGLLNEIQPAVGLPTFVLLFFVYFVLAFLLLSAAFLGVGAQAATMREIQLLSLPITMLQVGMFALASAAASRPGSTIATIAEIFPFSSPFAMAARAANSASLWPHALAIAWQLLVVALVVTLSARLFRIGVLKSGGGFNFGRKPKEPVSA